MASEAQRRALANYDKAHKDDFKRYNLRLHKENDAAIIDQIEKQDNKQGYIKQLILEDIKKNGH